MSILFLGIRSIVEGVMELDEENLSLIKVNKNFELVAEQYNCLICGKKGGVGGLKEVNKRTVRTFIEALKIRNECNGYPLGAYTDIIDFENFCLKPHVLIKWHRSYYSTFSNSTNLSYVNQTTCSFDKPISGVPITRSQKPLEGIKKR